MNTLFQSEHFTLHPLTEGVYAAIATEEGAGFSNAGLIDLGDHMLVFDAWQAIGARFEANVRASFKRHTQ